MRDNKGISMITLVITIICMVIFLSLAYRIGTRYIFESKEEERTALVAVLSDVVTRRQNDRYVGIGDTTLHYVGYHISSGDYDEISKNFENPNRMYEPGLWYILDADKAQDLEILEAQNYLVEDLKSKTEGEDKKYIAVSNYYTGEVELLKYEEVKDIVDSIVAGNSDNENGCEHEYTMVSCTEASVCTKCGKIMMHALGHDFNLPEPTCTEDRKCKRCGYIDKKAIGHEYVTDLSYNDNGHFNKCIRYDVCKAVGNFEDHDRKYALIPGDEWIHVVRCDICGWENLTEACTKAVRTKDLIYHVEYCTKCFKEKDVEHDEIKKYKWYDENEHIVYCDTCKGELYKEEHVDIEKPYGICDKCDGVLNMKREPEIKSVTMKNITPQAEEAYFAKRGDKIEIRIEVSMLLSGAPTVKLQDRVIKEESIKQEEALVWIAEINTADYLFDEGLMNIEINNIKSLWGIKGADVFETTDDKYIIYDSTKPQYIYIPAD